MGIFPLVISVFSSSEVPFTTDCPLYSSISQEAGVAVTVTRGCVGVWDMLSGRLVSQLADSPLGAIVTHAIITPDGK